MHISSIKSKYLKKNYEKTFFKYNNDNSIHVKCLLIKIYLKKDVGTNLFINNFLSN